MPSAEDTIFNTGDTIELQFQLFKNKDAGEYWNLLNHQIRFQLDTPTKIYKATSNVVGGAASQISFVDAITGIFLITIPASESINIVPGNYNYTIQVTTPAPTIQKFTVLQSSLRVVDAGIEWENKP